MASKTKQHTNEQIPSAWKRFKKRLGIAWRVLRQDHIITVTVGVQKKKDGSGMDVTTQLEIVGLPSHIAVSILHTCIESLEPQSPGLPAELQQILDKFRDTQPGSSSATPDAESGHNPFFLK